MNRILTFMYDMIAAIILSGFMALLWVLMTLDHRLHLYRTRVFVPGFTRAKLRHARGQ
jgi:hypothetical protein